MSFEISGQINYIFIRSLHWLSVGMQIRQHYRMSNRDAIIVVMRNMIKSLELIGLNHGRDFLTLQSLGAIFTLDPPISLSLHLHHHKKSIDEFWRIKRFIPNDVDIKISLFADGYTNLLVNREEISEFLEKNPEVKPNNLLFFDVAPAEVNKNINLFNIITIQSIGISALAQLSYFQEKSHVAASKCILDANGRPILLIMLRPWGSDVFHGGLLSFSDAAERLRDLILILISNIKCHIGQDIHVVIRPDDRDADLMRHFFELFKHSYEDPFTDLTSLWPADLILDPFLYNFDKTSDGTPLYVAGLDSTASLPFLKLGKGQRHYFGAPVAEAERMFSTKPHTWAMMQAKIARLERHARALATQQPIDIMKLDQLFFCATSSALNGKPG